MRHPLFLLLLLFGACPLTAQPSLAELIQLWEDHRGLGDDKPWPQWTAEEEAVEINFLREMVAGLKTIDLAGLDTDGRINHNMLSLLAADRLFGLEFGAHHFPLNAEGGFLAGIVYSLYGRNVPDREALLAYREKLRALPVYLRWQEEQLRKGIKAGRVSPQLIVDNCIAMVERALDKPLEASLFLKPVAEKPALRAAILPLVRDTILPAYAGLRDFLAGAYRAAAPPTIGAAVMQNGKKYYEQRVRFFTTYDVSPEEVFATGQREVARIRAEMEAIIDSVGFAGSFAEFLAFLRTDPQFYATSPEGLLREASWITKRMEAKLPKYFGHLPRMPLAVAPVPDALAPNYTGGRYSPGSYERHKAGEFWVNTYDLPSRPLYVLPALALHEGVPGHHTQMMLAAEENDRPGFRDTYLSAFGEGWALYAEYLGKEAGMYVTPYEDFGRLTYEMWRACRLVVDPGMHYFGWDRERAVAFLRDNTALSLHEVNTEIDRYVGWPGQAVSYKMGELKIRELRKLAESSLGKKFDLRAFHDLLLANGSVPLSVLEELVVGFIDARK